jgi:hypothetical protein
LEIVVGQQAVVDVAVAFLRAETFALLLSCEGFARAKVARAAMRVMKRCILEMSDRGEGFCCVRFRAKEFRQRPYVTPMLQGSWLY